MDRPEVPPLFCGVTVRVSELEGEASWDVAGVRWRALWSSIRWFLGREGRRVGPPLASLSQAVAYSLGWESALGGAAPTEGA